MLLGSAGGPLPPTAAGGAGPLCGGVGALEPLHSPGGAEGPRRDPAAGNRRGAAIPAPPSPVPAAGHRQRRRPPWYPPGAAPSPGRHPLHGAQGQTGGVPPPRLPGPGPDQCARDPGAYRKGPGSRPDPGPQRAHRHRSCGGRRSLPSGCGVSLSRPRGPRGPSPGGGRTAAISPPAGSAAYACPTLHRNPWDPARFRSSRGPDEGVCFT